jgi:hypothetical protein
MNERERERERKRERKKERKTEKERVGEREVHNFAKKDVTIYTHLHNV